jgi:hypothetical protein
MRQLNLNAPEGIEIFGNGKPDALAALDKYSSHKKSQFWHREPLQMIRQSLKEDRDGSVGGGVQIGILTPGGFQVSFDVQPLSFGDTFGQPFTKMMYRGFNFNDIGRVGDSFVTLTGVGG